MKRFLFALVVLFSLALSASAGNVGNLSTMGAPQGATFTLLTNPGNYFSVVGTEIVANPATPNGQYSVTVQASGGGLAQPIKKIFALNFANSVPWTPLNLGSALVAWWDAQAASSTSLSGSSVISWTDKVGGIVASQGTSGNRPTFSPTARNGKPGLVFASASSQRLLFNPAGLPTSARTVSVAGFAHTFDSGRVIFAYGQSSGGAGFNIFANPTVTFYDNSTAATSAEGWSNADRFATIGYNGSNTLSIKVDGGIVENFAQAIFTADVQGTIGDFVTGSGAPWDGSAQQILLTNRLLTATEQAQIEGWESWYDGKAGANLPVNDPYKTAPPLTSVNATIAPLVAGLPSSQVIPHTGSLALFSSALVVDGNNGAPLDTVTLTITGDPGATITGAGITGSNPYTIHAAANVNPTLTALQYQTTSPSGTVGAVSVHVVSSAGTSSNASTTLGGVPAETPYPAPVGAWTPMGNHSGVNLSGAELGFPDATGFAYNYPSSVELNYVAGKGLGLARLPLWMRRVQPISYGMLGAGDTEGVPFPGFTNLLAIKATLDTAFANGQYVVLDAHNGGFLFDTVAGVNRNVGPDAEANAQFQDWWVRMVTKFKNYPNVIWGLMNEPSEASAFVWHDALVPVISAIAAVTTTQLALIPGNCSTGAWTWHQCSNDTAWASYNPPAGMQVAYEVHQYLDSDGSGTHSTVVVGAGATRLNLATQGLAIDWARANGKKLFVGEFGWSRNDSQPSGGVPSVEGTALMASMVANSDVVMGWSYWLGGQNLYYHDDDNNYSVTPEGYIGNPPTGHGTYTDAPQMSILTTHIE